MFGPKATYFAIFAVAFSRARNRNLIGWQFNNAKKLEIDWPLFFEKNNMNGRNITEAEKDKILSYSGSMFSPENPYNVAVVEVDVAMFVGFMNSFIERMASAFGLVFSPASNVILPL